MGRPGELLGEKLGERPGEQPGKLPDELARELPGKLPGKLPDKLPGKLPNKLPGNPPSHSSCLSRVHCVFQTRQGGFSKRPFNDGNIAYTVNDDPAAILANRQALLAQLGLKAWAEENQVHGDEMVLDAKATPLESKGEHDADGLTTSEHGLGLMIKTADCQPLLLAHQSGKYIAALHVGWRGNRINFIGKAIKQFCAHYHIEPSQLLAVRGPSLGPEKAQFLNFDAEWGESFLPWFNQQNKTMDLWQLTRHQLTQAGVLEANIHGINLCTYTEQDMFFSFRRNKNLSGRQASFIWIE